MTRLAVPTRAAPVRTRSTGGAVLAALAVLGTYAVVVGAADGSVAHVVTRAGRDWPLLALAVAAVLAPAVLVRRARRRWQSGLATALVAVAAGVAFTAALGGGGHRLDGVGSALGVPLPTLPALTSAYAAWVAAGLLAAAWVSVRGAAVASAWRGAPVAA